MPKVVYIDIIKVNKNYILILIIRLSNNLPVSPVKGRGGSVVIVTTPASAPREERSGEGGRRAALSPDR